MLTKQSILKSLLYVLCFGAVSQGCIVDDSAEATTEYVRNNGDALGGARGSYGRENGGLEEKNIHLNDELRIGLNEKNEVKRENEKLRNQMRQFYASSKKESQVFFDKMEALVSDNQRLSIDYEKEKNKNVANEKK